MNRKLLFSFMLMMFAFLAAAVFLQGCGGGGLASGQNDKSSVAVEVSYPQDETPESKDKSKATYVAYYLIDVYGQINQESDGSATNNISGMALLGATGTVVEPVVPTTRIDYPQRTAVIPDVPIGEKTILIVGYDSDNNRVSIGKTTITVVAGSNPPLDVAVTDISPTSSPTITPTITPTPRVAAYFRVEHLEQYNQSGSQTADVNTILTSFIPVVGSIAGLKPMQITDPNGSVYPFSAITSPRVIAQNYYFGNNTIPAATNFTDPMSNQIGAYGTRITTTGAANIKGVWQFNIDGHTKTDNNQFDNMGYIGFPYPYPNWDTVRTGQIYADTLDMSWNSLGTNCVYFVQIYNIEQVDGSGNYIITDYWTNVDITKLDMKDPVSFRDFINSLPGDNIIGGSSVTVPGEILYNSGIGKYNTRVSITAIDKSSFRFDATSPYPIFSVNTSRLEYYIGLWQ